MKHRRWITILFAAVIVIALCLVSGGVTEAEASGILTVDWYDGEGWYAPLACGSAYHMEQYKYECHYTLYAPCYVECYSINVTLPEGFYYMDGTTSKPAAIIPSCLNNSGDFILEEIMTPYLPNAKAGDVYYADVSFQGSGTVDWENYFPVTQEFKVPILRITEVRDEVTVSDAELGECTVTWNESMLTNDYNQEAAELSAVLSRLAYDEEAIKDVLTQLGCYSVTGYNTGWNKDHMRYFIGEKLIIQNGKQRKVIFAVGRGTVGSEWFGNLNVGSGAIHQGFLIAGSDLHTGAYECYEWGNSTREESFIFFTGHSKAGAAANLAAHWANSAGLDCVAYTFATPAVEKGIGTTTSGEKGIYNWVYYQDAIRNAPSMAQYGRYGSTRIFGFEIPEVDYTAEDGTDISWTDSYGYTHRTRYGYTMQEYLNALLLYMDTNNKSGTAMYIGAKLQNVQVSLSEVYNTAIDCHSMRYYYAAVKQGDSGADIQSVMQRTEQAAFQLDVIAADLIPDEDKLIQHQFYCPVNVFVYDTAGNLVGSILGDQVTTYDNDLILYTLLDSSVVMYLESMEGQYSISVIGYAEGTVTHSTTYYSINGIEEMLVSESVPVSLGQTVSFASDPHGDSGYTTYTDEAEIEEVVCGLLGVESENGTMSFTDVSESSYYYTSVLWAVERGITNGTTATTFSPENPCTRGQIVTFLWRAFGSPEPSSTENPFTDVPSNMYYYKAILWAVERGITTGTSSTTFSPEDTCTRGQVATFLWRACGKPAPAGSENPFSDVPETVYYYEPILWAVEKGITNGTGSGKFSPEDSCTRGQIVTFLYRALAE